MGIESILDELHADECEVEFYSDRHQVYWYAEILSLASENEELASDERRIFELAALPVASIGGFPSEFIHGASSVITETFEVWITGARCREILPEVERPFSPSMISALDDAIAESDDDEFSMETFEEGWSAFVHLLKQAVNGNRELCTVQSGAL
jgi:hypothetical protein